MTITKTENGTLIPDDAFGLVFGADGQITTVVPTVGEDEPISNGHILIIGLARKLQDPEWAKALLEETSEVLKKAHELATAMNSSEKV